MPDQAHQFARIFVAVILVLQHHIFKRDAPGVVGTGIIGTGLQQVFDAIFTIDRHNLVADDLRHRMQRHRQIDPDFAARPRHHRHDAGCRQRDPPLRQRQSIAVHDNRQTRLQIVEIIKRFAHPHHHDVGQHPAFGLRGPFAQRVARQHHLPDNFAGGQVADQFHGSGIAKTAVERAADLRRHA